jgi:cell division protein ZapD
MFEILEVASRADLKSDLLQELDRQRTFLDALRSNPAISEDKLESVLQESSARSPTCMRFRQDRASPPRERMADVDQAAREHSRRDERIRPAFVPPVAFHSPERRRGDLTEWLSTLLPVHAALSIVLRVLRESGRTSALIAFQGVYQQTPAEKPAQMLRLALGDELPCVPEISANKYALNVRFLLPEGVQKTRVYEHDVPFELTFCNL